MFGKTLEEIEDEDHKEIVEIIRNNYLKEGMEPTGKLANFTWNFSYDNNLFQLQLMLPPEWKWVELGRRPSAKMPPVNAYDKSVSAVGHLPALLSYPYPQVPPNQKTPEVPS